MLAAQDSFAAAECNQSITGESIALEASASMLSIEPHSNTTTASDSQADNRDIMENGAYVDQTHDRYTHIATTSSNDTADGTDTTRSRLRRQRSPLPGTAFCLDQQQQLKFKSLHEPGSPRSPTNPDFSTPTFHDHYSHRFLSKKASDDSIRSNISTNSVISAANKLSRFPQAVIKSSIGSVKGFVSKTISGKSRNNRLTLVQSSGAVLPDQQHPQTIHYSTPASAPFGDRESIASRLRRKAPSSLGLYTMFASQSQKEQCLHVADAIEDVKSGCSTTNDSDIGTTNPPPISSPRLYDIHAGPRNNTKSASAVHLVSPAPPRLEEKTFAGPSPAVSSEVINRLDFDGSIAAVGDPKVVGELLFGVDIGNMDFFEQELGKSATSSTLSGVDDCDLDPIETSPDAKSDYSISEIGRDGAWGRQRAKSCQETKMTSLRQLTRGQFASTAALNSHIPSPTVNPINPSEPSKETNDTPYDGLRDVILPATADIPPIQQDQQQQNRKLANAKIGALYNKILVTATLTTLHSKLINDCDQLLATTILPPPPSQTVKNEPRKFPEDALRRTVNDLQKMTDMVEWEAGDGPMSKRAVVAFFRAIEDQIEQGSSMTMAAYTTAQPPSKKDKNIRPADPSQMIMATSVKNIVSSINRTAPTSCSIE
ncbi:hypothetical protein BX666DRAFT_280350 [Dichotomocladium elegans]|nr:hypothetical protein BX666DRAFT_280350 [Dichotomocladium elegans]